MTRREFDSYFAPMVQALGKKIPKIQADYQFEHFKGVHHLDFKEACAYLARGNYMPTQGVFDDSVAAAREMRLSKEKQIEARQVRTFVLNGPPPPPEPMHPLDELLQYVCFSLISPSFGQGYSRRTPMSLLEIESTLRDEAFVKHIGGTTLSRLRDQLAIRLKRKESR